jgi:hypothetical protein
MACWGRSTVCSPSAPLDFGFSLEAYGCSGVVFIVVFRALAEGRDVEGRVDAEGGGRTEVSSSVGPREKPASPTGTACHPDAMASNGSFPGPPGDGWQQRTLPMLAGLAAEDARISCLRVHGSASGTAASADRWSDLDLMITTTEPAVEAEDFARQIGRRLSPVFAASRSGNSSSYCVRLVLRDVRRIDVTATALAGDDGDLASGARSENLLDAVAEVIGAFHFDAVLAAVKAARGDVPVGTASAEAAGTHGHPNWPGRPLPIRGLESLRPSVPTPQC